jgi:hypothetical protein
MHSRKKTSRYVSLGVIALVGLMALLLWPSLVTAVPVTHGQKLDRAARLAGDVGTYQYRTDVLQTTHPTLRIENAGRQPETSRMTVDGAVNRANASM